MTDFSPDALTARASPHKHMPGQDILDVEIYEQPQISERTQRPLLVY
jgi:hypothetical protein